MSFAAKTAIEKAKTAGTAWVGVNAATTRARRRWYAAMPLEHDMIGLYLAVGNANHMAPWGGIDLLLSTIRSRWPRRETKGPSSSTWRPRSPPTEK